MTVWPIVEKKLNDEDQRQIVVKLFEKSQTFFIGAHPLNVSAINLMFESIQRLFKASIIQDLLMMQHDGKDSFLHCAMLKSEFSLFKIVSNFMEEKLDKDNFKKLLWRDDGFQTILCHNCSGKLITVEILKLYDKYLNSEEFFEIITSFENYYIFLKSWRAFEIAEFKQIWQILVNKIDSVAQLIQFLTFESDYSETVLDFILRIKDRERLNFLQHIFYQWLTKNR